MESQSRSLQKKCQWTLKWQKNKLVPLLQEEESWNKVEKFWREQRFLDYIGKLIGFHQSTKILDVGCGITTVLRFLGGIRVGIDPLAEEYNELLPYPKDVTIYQSLGESMDFKDNSFDVVFCTNCIDHVINPEKVMHEIKRVLGENKHLVLTCEIHPEDIGFRNEGHPHTFTAEKLSYLLNDWQVLRKWSTPWQGIFRYLTHEPPAEREEYVYLCRNIRQL